ncbi:globin domain-containing protein [Streptomyces rapamycinicus]|uniref:nitric oxide dioxygenase n=2 Tax=Streptomyces rapamycinicus TaxID=1226757 RepID=A0A0A0NW06_STRRN|nr:globin domain-containing protein [Streptomyces rapamycinicus]AGP61133.1 hemin transporter [Streptomyces rapamycinicus NRRL 5491]MBB4787691.1 nitric oxide dioxygenase [Streptomyces rapamycinicus]RLV72031.1 hemin transporter [Streptomyces rapamycinicus NRRL 5491]UTP36640.1 globin domain-containing protein [Streptomyces rapamycinicus NRRL 5491]
MLSLESAAVIRATLPVVSEALDEITAHFYGTMFAERPELLDGLFNRGNQASGEQRKALAGSIAAFAQALPADPDARPDALLSRIAHKHAALGVTEDQYTIVHKYLFQAIGDVLGDAVTAEVASAWDEVYWLMAGALMAQEARLYQEAQVDPRYPWRQWTVVERREETANVASFLLRPADDGPLPAARAGQYVSVRVLMPDGIHQTRQYSLSGAPGDRLRRITVKRVAGVAGAPEGEVSGQLHRTVRTGVELTLSAPFGDVVLDDRDTPLVLVSAGIGCNPMVGMLEHLAATGSARPVRVLHADHAPADHALRADTRRLVAQLPDARAEFWYERDAAGEAGARTGLMDFDGLDLSADADVYLCGPLPFMRAVRALLRRAGVPACHIRYEVFGPDLWLPHGEG